MKIRKAKNSEIKEIKGLLDSFKEMDVSPETFPEKYYQRILKKGILLVAVENKMVVGVCFGTYNTKEGWADLLGLAVEKELRKKGIGSLLIKQFEIKTKSKRLKTIDLYSDKNQVRLFRKLGYKEGRTYTSFRKKLF